MMTIDDIKALIVSDESRTLVLKKSTGELKDGRHAACAFLNTEGGWLIFGITPKSLKIIGQQVTDDTQREVGLSDRSTIDQARGRTAQPPTKYRPITPKLAPITTEITIEDSKSTTESTIEALMSSIEFTNGKTEHKIIGLLKLDGSLTIAQLYPLLKMSRKGVLI